MFPIRDHNPSGRTPWITRVLIALNFIVFLLTWVMPEVLLGTGEAVAGEKLSSDELTGFLFYIGGMVPAFVSEGEMLHGFLTAQFLHAGWMHLLGNMLFLWIFGDNLEDAFGPLKYLCFYLTCGAAAAFAQYLADPASEVPMVGASGSIAGVLGGYLLLYPRAKVDVLLIFIIFFRVFTIPAWIVLMVWFGLQVLGVTTPDDPEGGDMVAYWAHAGGFMAGLALALPFFIRQGGPRFWAKFDGHPPHPEAGYVLSASRIPQVVRRK